MGYNWQKEQEDSNQAHNRQSKEASWIAFLEHPIHKKKIEVKRKQKSPHTHQSSWPTLPNPEAKSSPERQLPRDQAIRTQRAIGTCGKKREDEGCFNPKNGAFRVPPIQETRKREPETRDLSQLVECIQWQALNNWKLKAQFESSTGSLLVLLLLVHAKRRTVYMLVGLAQNVSSVYSLAKRTYG